MIVTSQNSMRDGSSFLIALWARATCRITAFGTALSPSVPPAPGLGPGRQPSPCSGTTARVGPGNEGGWRLMFREGGKEEDRSHWSWNWKGKTWRLILVQHRLSSWLSSIFQVIPKLQLFFLFCILSAFPFSLPLLSLAPFTSFLPLSRRRQQSLIVSRAALGTWGVLHACLLWQSGMATEKGTITREACFCHGLFWY